MRILIAVPAYNEEKSLEKNILRLKSFCQDKYFGQYLVVIADNNSQDSTGEIGKNLASQHQEVEYLFVAQQGKGLAIKTAWEKFSADVYCFMDADLATDLNALPSLIHGIINEGNDIVIGSRFHGHSVVERSLARKALSRGYKILLKILLGIKTSDLPCGFKAINQRTKEAALPQIQDGQWFFDSELIILSEKMNFKIKEIPVTWHDAREAGDKSRVVPTSLALAYFKKAWAMKRRLDNQKNDHKNGR